MSSNTAAAAVGAGSSGGRAAEYVRMSTEHQQYSTENQRDKIRDYAARRGFEIVRTYADEGKSGLRIDGRQALQNLIADVANGKADFSVILVYDVSRWLPGNRLRLRSTVGRRPRRTAIHRIHRNRTSVSIDQRVSRQPGEEQSKGTAEDER